MFRRDINLDRNYREETSNSSLGSLEQSHDTSQRLQSMPLYLSQIYLYAHFRIITIEKEEKKKKEYVIRFFECDMDIHID